MKVKINKKAAIVFAFFVFLFLSVNFAVSECPEQDYTIYELRSDIRAILFDYLSGSGLYKDNEIRKLIDFYNSESGNLVVEDCDDKALDLIKPSETSECSDGIDNDGDGKVDLKDGGCIDEADTDETNCGDGVCEGPERCSTCTSDCGVCPECNDGIDNDGDGDTDTSDGGCTDAADTDETNCGDGICETGESCLGYNDYESCTDNVCYEPTCTNGCVQTAVSYGITDEACSGIQACDGSGNCKTANGNACSIDANCLGGVCCNGICQDSICTVCGDGTCDVGENCPADVGSCTDRVCYTAPVCTDGCVDTPISSGSTDTGCTATTGCSSPPCECDGTGDCEEAPDYTAKSCNVDGSASPTGVECGLGDANKNEGEYGGGTDRSDATSDNCRDRSNGRNHIEDIYLDAKRVPTGATVQVTCRVYCYYWYTEYAILYNSGSGWVNKAYGTCTGSGYQDKIASVTVDDIVGTHYFRCWASYSGCYSSNTCCTSTYADNDDISIEVIDSH